MADHLEQEGIDTAALLQVYFTLQNPLRQPLDLPDLITASIGNIAREGQPVLPIDQTWLSLMLKERPTGITGSWAMRTASARSAPNIWRPPAPPISPWSTGTATSRR